MSEIKLTKTENPKNKCYDYAYCTDISHKKGSQTYKIFRFDAPVIHPDNIKRDERHPELSYFEREGVGVYTRLFKGDILTVTDEKSNLILTFNRLEIKPKMVVYQEPAASYIHLLSAKEAKRAGFVYENKSPSAKRRNIIKQSVSFLFIAAAFFASCKFADTHTREIKDTTAPVVEKISDTCHFVTKILDNQIQR